MYSFDHSVVADEWCMMYRPEGIFTSLFRIQICILSYSVLLVDNGERTCGRRRSEVLS